MSEASTSSLRATGLRATGAALLAAALLAFTAGVQAAPPPSGQARITPHPQRVTVAKAYNVGGARDFVLKMAPQVDGVLTGGWARLKRYVETGKP